MSWLAETANLLAETTKGIKLSKTIIEKKKLKKKKWLEEMTYM